MKKRISTAAVLGTLVLVLAIAPAAFAGKGGAGGKGGGSTSSGAALSGVVSGGSYTVNGTGFRAGELVALQISEAGGCCNATNIVADSSGSFTYLGTIWGPGVYTVSASRLVRSRWAIVARWSFTA